ncbi:16S rRNA m(2)G 1207 methyltransferase /23S rRNA m(2)G-1835 methyltransferase [Modestobacter sp. DSM 44400]|uniref:class I SAM-dependent methyltransferase n=1 Tax=Modestobacter sp. DSM 44400 TaxID=1550230 RepID=UPI00089C260A|nr:methyltransferase [Modestobacter sp. DSM 44400]SDY10361.1 16S rRNA m(2)G 1207 methyltransferase /23S rRNA m(2)G-1835 methyltransferase [Modestobacter sp. DSM 44400]
MLPSGPAADLFDLLRREPDVEAPDLVAVDATDRLLLDEAAGALAVDGDRVAVVDDSHGALTLGAVVLHGAVDVRVHQDLLVGELALGANAARLERTGSYRSLPLAPELVQGARVVLAKAPKSLDGLRELAEVVAADADPAVTLYVGGRLKHMTRAMNDVLGDCFTDVSATLARQKSRVLVARGPRPVTPSFPRCREHADLGVTLCAHGAAFAGAKVARGTRALLAALPQAAPDATSAVDLSCGTGLLAVALATARPGLTVLATDQSAAAVASARATLAANGLGNRVRVSRDDAAAGVPDASVDLVVCNPPFHLGVAVHTGVAERLFAAAARVLRPGGEFWCVYNSHLPHRDTLRRLIGPTRQVSRDPVFTVAVSTRR